MKPSVLDGDAQLPCLNSVQRVSSRIGENLEQSLPSLRELILTSNNIQELVSVAGATPPSVRSSKLFSRLDLDHRLCLCSSPEIHNH